MENRSEIVKEYFDLIVYLNRGNIKTNQKTKITFEIRKNGKVLEFGCTLKGVVNPPFLVLVRKSEKGIWLASGQTRFIYIEDYSQRILTDHGLRGCKTIEDRLRSLEIFHK